MPYRKVYISILYYARRNLQNKHNNVYILSAKYSNIPSDSYIIQYASIILVISSFMCNI